MKKFLLKKRLKNLKKIAFKSPKENLRKGTSLTLKLKC